VSEELTTIITVGAIDPWQRCGILLADCYCGEKRETESGTAEVSKRGGYNGVTYDLVRSW
jgi:hypothetical protein